MTENLGRPKLNSQGSGTEREIRDPLRTGIKMISSYALRMGPDKLGAKHTLSPQIDVITALRALDDLDWFEINH